MKVCTVCGTEWTDDTNFCPSDGAVLRSTGAAELVGSIIAGRYRITRKLGEGGMGTVYLGEHVKMHRPSAIKVLTQSLAHNADAVARFNREAANAARINHQHVCAIYDFGETDEGLIYLAMEYIEGETLSELLRREDHLKPARAAAIVDQTANALQAAHDLGIVHRDLKPDNIMVTRARDGTDFVKVVDFGIAKAMGSDEEQKVTRTGLVIGTPEYMSPEQLSGDVLDGRSDLYSLALVFFRTITGTLPFLADTAQEMLVKRLTDDPLSLSAALPAEPFPPRLQAVMDRALQRMPGDRYSSATEFARDIGTAVGEGRAPVAAPRGGADATTEVVSRAGGEDWLPPTRLSPASSAVTVPQHRPAPVRHPGTPPVGKRRTVAIVASLAALAAGGVGVALAFRGGGSAAEQPRDTIGAIRTMDTVPPGDNRSRSTPDTVRIASQPERGGSPQPTATGPAGEGTRRSGGGGASPSAGSQATVDLGAVSRELFTMIDQVFDPGTRPGAMQRSKEIFEDARFPDSLRAQAASLVGTGHFELGESAQACEWARRAQARAPGNQSYARMLATWGCGR